jgi:hypothetical protein
MTEIMHYKMYGKKIDANVLLAHRVSINNLMMNDRNGGSGVSHGDVQSGWMMP